MTGKGILPTDRDYMARNLSANHKGKPLGWDSHHVALPMNI